MFSFDIDKTNNYSEPNMIAEHQFPIAHAKFGNNIRLKTLITTPNA